MQAAFKKSKQYLSRTVVGLLDELRMPDLDPYRKDAVFRFLGSISEIVLQKKNYKKEVEQWLLSYVFPEFQSQHRFLRMRVGILA